MYIFAPHKSFFFLFFFSIRVFSCGHWQLTGQQGKGGGHFFSTTSTRSRAFRHLFATLHVIWLSHIFNRTACFYQTATPWDLPPYRITIWLIDDLKLVFLFAYLMIWYEIFVTAILIRETGGLELASTTTLVLQENRLTKFGQLLDISPDSSIFFENFWFRIFIYWSVVYRSKFSRDRR